MQEDEEEKQSITDKEFYKAMQKLKERGTNAVPPKKSASAYIIFGKEVRHNQSIYLNYTRVPASLINSI